MLLKCTGSIWSAIICQYVKYYRYCSMWLHDLWQMPKNDSHQFPLCPLIWHLNGLLRRTVLCILGFFICSQLNFRSFLLILNFLHLNYIYSMNNSILKQLEKVCLCMHAFWKATTSSNLLTLFRYHLKIKKCNMKRWKIGRKESKINLPNIHLVVFKQWRFLIFLTNLVREKIILNYVTYYLLEFLKLPCIRKSIKDP